GSLLGKCDLQVVTGHTFVKCPGRQAIERIAWSGGCVQHQSTGDTLLGTSGLIAAGDALQTCRLPHDAVRKSWQSFEPCRQLIIGAIQYFAEFLARVMWIRIQVL